VAGSCGLREEHVDVGVLQFGPLLLEYFECGVVALLDCALGVDQHAAVLQRLQLSLQVQQLRVHRLEFFVLLLINHVYVFNVI